MSRTNTGLQETLGSRGWSGRAAREDIRQPLKVTETSNDPLAMKVSETGILELVMQLAIVRERIWEKGYLKSSGRKEPLDCICQDLYHPACSPTPHISHTYICIYIKRILRALLTLHVWLNTNTIPFHSIPYRVDPNIHRCMCRNRVRIPSCPDRCSLTPKLMVNNHKNYHKTPGAAGRATGAGSMQE